jgi:transposase
MNWDQIEGNWKQVKGVVKKKWGKLTDDDVDVIAGKRDILSLVRYKRDTGSHVKRQKRNSRPGRIL